MTTPKKKPAAKADSSTLKSILAALARRVPKSRLADAEAFAGTFYQRMSREEFAQHGAEGWAALAADILDFAAVRKPGTANVRLFNAGIKESGWESPHTVLQVVNDDMPFLVDSVTMKLAELGVGVHVLGHPVVPMQRDKAGKLQAAGKGTPESFMHLEIDRQPQAAMKRIEAEIRTVLEQVRAIVRDWPAMQAKMLEVAGDLGKRDMPTVPKAGVLEAQEFLRWAAGEHFTFLGYREYAVKKQGKEEMLVADEGSGLGLLRGKDGGKTPQPKDATELSDEQTAVCRMLGLKPEDYLATLKAQTVTA